MDVVELICILIQWLLVCAFRDAIIPNRCMLRRLVLGEGDAVYDAWLFSFHMHRLVAAESEHLGGTA